MTEWQHQVGSRPIVTVFERRDRGGMLYLRWWDPKRQNWHAESLSRRLRSRFGNVKKKVATWAVKQAWAKYQELVAPPNSVPEEIPSVVDVVVPTQPPQPTIPQPKRVKVRVRRSPP